MRFFIIAIISITVFLLGTLHECTAAQGEEKPASRKWEFKAVNIGTGEKEATKKLNALASEGWDYIGPLANGLVAFRRHYVPREQILIEIMGQQPKTPAPGEKVAIVVIARTGERSLLPGATVTIAAGGGDFLTEAGKPIDRKDRGAHPNSVRGTTDAKGQFTAYWLHKTGPATLVLGIEVSKKDYTSAPAELLIRVRPR